MRNPYKVVKYENGIYGVEYKDKRFKFIGFPDSWGTKAHATAYIAARLGLTVDEMRRTRKT